MAAQQKGFGVLSTVGTKEGIEGFPVGSVVGFAVDERGRPIFCFSSMSAHTKNLVGDARASLTVTEPSFQGAADARCVRRGSVLEAFQLGLSMPRSARAQVLTGRVTRVTDAAVADELRAVRDPNPANIPNPSRRPTSRRTRGRSGPTSATSTSTAWRTSSTSPSSAASRGLAA